MSFSVTFPTHEICFVNLQVLVGAHGHHGHHEVGVQHEGGECDVDDGVERHCHEGDVEPVDRPLGRRYRRRDEIQGGRRGRSRHCRGRSDLEPERQSLKTITFVASTFRQYILSVNLVLFYHLMFGFGRISFVHKS